MALIVQAFDPKRIDEDIVVTFEFANVLGAGVGISTQVCTAQHFKGPADAAPENVISGSASATGTEVSQLLVDGTDGTTYAIVCKITTDETPPQKLHGVGLIQVSDSLKAA